MPVTKSAIKKLRQDKKRTAANKKIIYQLNSAIKGIKKSKKITIDEAYSKIDKAAKKGLIHSNKAARLKSQLSKIAPNKIRTETTSKKTSSVSKKTVTKPKKASK